jgi:hypothetical protein
MAAAVHPCLTFAATAATAAAAADTQHSKSKMATAVCAFAEFSGVWVGELMNTLSKTLLLNFNWEIIFWIKFLFW